MYEENLLNSEDNRIENLRRQNRNYLILEEEKMEALSNIDNNANTFSYPMLARMCFINDSTQISTAKTNYTQAKSIAIQLNEYLTEDL